MQIRIALDFKQAINKRMILKRILFYPTTKSQQ